MAHVRSMKHRKSHHKLSKTNRPRGTRVRRGGTPGRSPGKRCMTCHTPYDRANFNLNKDECKKCERLKPWQSSTIRSVRDAHNADKKSELAAVMEKRRSEELKVLKDNYERAKKALEEYESTGK